MSACCFLVSANLTAGPKEQADQIHNRITGVPAASNVQQQLESLITQGKIHDAILLAMDNPLFLNLTIKNWAMTWTNVDESPVSDLNDYVATVIGMVRDNVSFDQILFGDMIYVGAATLNLPAYSLANNDHYLQLQTRSIDLKANLVQQTQTQTANIQGGAGALTSRAFGAAFYSGGTNRRALRFSLKTFICNDMEQMSDTSVPDFHVRRDVTRSPGGDSSIYRNKCVGCHAGMDALAGAFAHFDFVNNTLINNTTKVIDKFNINVTEFPDGFRTVDDSWENLWTVGQNARIGWQGSTQGNGVREFGKMLSQTQQFPVCMATRAFKKVCQHEPSGPELDAIKQISQTFVNSQYNVKELFAASLMSCMGN